MPLEWVSVSQRLPVHPWEGTCDWQSEILFVGRGPKEHALKFHFLNQIIQSLSHTKMYIKIKKKAKHTITSTVESTCKSLTRRIVTTTDSTFVSPCLGIQNMITACLLQKNTIPCHSAQCKTMKTYNVNFPLPKNIFIHCIYLVLAIHEKPFMFLGAVMYRQNTVVVLYKECIIHIHLLCQELYKNT